MKMEYIITDKQHELYKLLKSSKTISFAGDAANLLI